MVASSLFMPSIEALERTTDLNSLENENNIYEAVDILIAEGGGGGGGMNARKRKEKKLKDAAKSIKFFWKERKKAIEKGESPTKIDKKIKKYEDIIKKLVGEGEGVNIPIGEGEGDDPRSRGLIPDSLVPKEPTKVKEKKVLPKIDPIFNDARAPKEKIAISKLDDVGTSFRGGLVKEQIKKLTAKIAIASISNISAKIVKLQDEAKNINPANIDEWLKKTDEIALKIAALEDLQKRIDDHLNYTIDSVVYCIKFMDNPLLKTEGVKVLQKKAIYMNNYYSLLAKAEPAGIIDAELGRALKDMNLLTTIQFDFAYRVNSKD